MTKKKQDQSTRYKTVKVPALNVRAQPSKDSLVLNALVFHELVECDPNFDNPEWDHIIADPNIKGYCMKEFLEPLDVDSKAKLYLDTITIKKPEEDDKDGEEK